MDAVRYGKREGILFNVDEEYLLRAEGELRGRGEAATPHDLEAVFYDNLGHCYDRTDLLPGGENFNFLVGRYGDGWIYVPLKGYDPEREEREALRLLRRPLKQKEPYPGGDLLDLATKYMPRLRDTGFPHEADLNLLFHAALRLAGRGELEVVEDNIQLAPEESGSYGRRQFLLSPDVEVPLENALCDTCQAEYDASLLSLHYECAARLQKALSKVAPRSKRK
jgi:hypothetical protein